MCRYDTLGLNFLESKQGLNVDRPAQAQVAGLLYVVSTIQAVRSPALVVNDPGSSFEEYLLAEASPLDYPEKV